MTELTPYEPRNEMTLADPTGGRLVAWAQAMSAAHKLGTALCETAFVPQQFKGKPDEAAAAIMYGDEIGFTPGQSLQNVYVISGKPSLYARAMVALVLSHGHQIWTEASSPQRVIVCGQRRGSSHVERVEWTHSKAQQAGYTSNKKYTTDPESMLYARASGDVARRIAPDALAGIAYTREELELEEAGTATATPRQEPKKRTAKRAAAAPAPQAEEPELDEPPPPPAEPESDTGDSSDTSDTGDTAAMVTQPQMQKLQASFNDVGVNNRDRRLAITGYIIGREIGSANDLTKHEASLVIERLGEVQAMDPEDQKVELGYMTTTGSDQP